MTSQGKPIWTWEWERAKANKAARIKRLKTLREEARQRHENGLRMDLTAEQRAFLDSIF